MTIEATRQPERKTSASPRESICTLHACVGLVLVVFWEGVEADVQPGDAKPRGADPDAGVAVAQGAVDRLRQRPKQFVLLRVRRRTDERRDMGIAGGSGNLF